MLLHQRLVRELAQCGQVGGNRRLGFRLQPFRRRNRVFPPILRPGTPFSRAGVCDAGPAKATFCLEIAIGKPKHSDFGLICGVYNVFGRGVRATSQVSSPGPGSESLCSRRHTKAGKRQRDIAECMAIQVECKTDICNSTLARMVDFTTCLKSTLL